MCTTFWYQSNTHERYKLVVAFNRDEDVKRPYKPVHYWEANSSILAGLDVPSRGTWIGINATNGNVAFLTNCEFVPWSAVAPELKNTRGYLITSFLHLKEKFISPADYDSIFKHVLARKKELNGFNLVYTNIDANCSYYTNNFWKEDKILALPGDTSYSLSNGIYTSDLHKAESNRHIFADILKSDLPLDHFKECVLQLMLCERPAPEEKLQPKEKPEECKFEMNESGIFVREHAKKWSCGGFNAATLWTGLIIVEKNNHMHFYERIYDQTKERKGPIKVYPTLEKHGISEKDLAKVEYEETHLDKVIGK
eukprot:TRINITY_DN15197_c0_g2_i5.p1 TRINITY_DN15197_c0_g2~~TRINITY_DN15197_c0_g2_i5.p1  ORF type:complete len:310 (+),score=65.68 TRINITY_DN15197_c0_g2_i5:90-1019(+)